MRVVGAYEAKTHLSGLLDFVAGGEEIMITRNGAPVAMLSPCVPEKKDIEEIIDALFVLRKKTSLGSLSIDALKKEGRR